MSEIMDLINEKRKIEKDLKIFKSKNEELEEKITLFRKKRIFNFMRDKKEIIFLNFDKEYNIYNIWILKKFENEENKTFFVDKITLSKKAFNYVKNDYEKLTNLEMFFLSKIQTRQIKKAELLKIINKRFPFLKESLN
jgi:hypothetical protein